MSSSAEENAGDILDRLEEEHPDARIWLDWESPFQLLVATILAAQCTDERVNNVTPELFQHYPGPEELAEADEEDVQKMVRSTGFYRRKTESIQKVSRAIAEEHGGEVPDDRGALTDMPGVGRKTANVVLNTAFGKETLAVDTHIFRIGNRLRIAPGKTPEEVERNFLRIIPDGYLRHAHHWLILHGRYVCKARKPDCPACIIADLCKAEVKTTDVPAPLIRLETRPAGEQPRPPVTAVG